MAHTFNGLTKRIILDPSLPDVNVKELYSDWKEWALQGSNLQYLQAMRTFGGDPTVEGQTAPAYYFLTNGWRCVVDGFDAVVSYNLYTDEGENPIITLNGGTALLNNSDVGIVKTAFEQEQDYAGVVHIDFIGGVSGTEYPLGTASEPVDNFADAVTIAESYGIKEIRIEQGSGEMDVNIINYTVIGSSPQSCGVIMTGDQNGIYRNTKFTNLHITGTACGRGWNADKCSLEDVYMVAGYIKECGLKGTIGLSNRVNDDTGVVYESVFYQCVSEVPGFGSPTLDMVQGYPTHTSFRSYSGGLLLKYVDHAEDTATLEYVAGKLTLDVTCTNGEISVRGIVKITDNSNGLTVDDSATVSQLVDLSQATVTVGDITVDVDEQAIAVATRVEMDANSTKLASIDTDVSSLNITDITNGQTNILTAISGVDTKIDDIDAEVDAIRSETTELLEASNSLNVKIDALPTLTEMNAGLSIPAGITASDIWTYNDRSLTQAVATESLNEESLHDALDSYTNKSDWKATNTVVDNAAIAQATRAEMDSNSTSLQLVHTGLAEIESQIIQTKQEVQNLVIPTIEDIRSEIVDVVHGGLEIANDQLIIKDGSGQEVCRFNLFDSQGNPTMASVFSRERV